MNSYHKKRSQTSEPIWNKPLFNPWRLIVLTPLTITGFFFFFLIIFTCITKTIQVRRTRHAGHCWRSRDELIRDVLLWIPTHGRVKAGRPARTYIQQLCEDTGCCPEDLPRAMNDREEWRERVRDIRATSAIWWWWFLPVVRTEPATSWWFHWEVH